jgi:hypothetical protein
MQNLEEIKRRFMKNDLAVRLGCIASNLARVESFSKMPNNRKAIADLIEESKFFIEWATPEADSKIQPELVAAQVKLALWQQLKNRKEISQDAGKLAEKILKLSGLLKS